MGENEFMGKMSTKLVYSDFLYFETSKKNGPHPSADFPSICAPNLSCTDGENVGIDFLKSSKHKGYFNRYFFSEEELSVLSKILFEGEKIEVLLSLCEKKEEKIQSEKAGIILPPVFPDKPIEPMVSPKKLPAKNPVKTGFKEKPVEVKKSVEAKESPKKPAKKVVKDVKPPVKMTLKNTGSSLKKSGNNQLKPPKNVPKTVEVKLEKEKTQKASAASVKVEEKVLVQEKKEDLMNLMFNDEEYVKVREEEEEKIAAELIEAWVSSVCKKAVVKLFKKTERVFLQETEEKKRAEEEKSKQAARQARLQEKRLVKEVRKHESERWADLLLEQMIESVCQDLVLEMLEAMKSDIYAQKQKKALQPSSVVYVPSNVTLKPIPTVITSSTNSSPVKLNASKPPVVTPSKSPLFFVPTEERPAIFALPKLESPSNFTASPFLPPSAGATPLLPSIPSSTSSPLNMDSLKFHSFFSNQSVITPPAPSPSKDPQKPSNLPNPSPSISKSFSPWSHSLSDILPTQSSPAKQSVNFDLELPSPPFAKTTIAQVPSLWGLQSTPVSSPKIFTHNKLSASPSPNFQPHVPAAQFKSPFNGNGSPQPASFSWNSSPSPNLLNSFCSQKDNSSKEIH